MLLKGIFCFCIQAVLFKAVFSQCIPPSLCPREPLCSTNLPVVEGYNLAGLSPLAPLYGRVIGGNIIVDTSAPYAPSSPTGVTIFSDNLIIEGTVLVSGNLPFLGTVGLEGILPAAGYSAVSYGCGTGNVGIDGISGPVTEVVLPAGSIIGTPGCAGYNKICLRL